MTRRSWLIYGVLLAIWGTLLAWQFAEHNRVRKSARAALINRAKDISDILGVAMRSQRRFGGVISKERFESTMHDLLKPGELNAIAILNAAGDVVASAGEDIDLHPRGVVQSVPRWDSKTVTIMNLVDLGTNVTQDLERPNPTIVLPRSELTNRPPPPPREQPPAFSLTNVIDEGFVGPPVRRPRSRFGRPPGMTEEQYKALVEKQSVHSFLMVMSTDAVQAASRQDFWMRTVIMIFGTISVLGSGLAWRTFSNSSELQIRLVRASELNLHLKQMNLAAAGLAHETRNPLNIIRGLAQMISKQQDAPSEIQKKSSAIVEEADRVTAQLNEFINFSRPREVRRAAVSLDGVVNEVLRTLSYDIEEKNVSAQLAVEPLTIEADEQLLRQSLFNLLINAIQAVPQKGEIRIEAARRNGSAVLEISDNGPGVAPEHRSEVFKPYFTTNQKGTGLGLAVVQQIVLAHGWEIQYLPNEPRGAKFRLTHLKLANRT